MPVYTSRDLIPFVNNLEERINAMMESLSQWNEVKYDLVSLPKQVQTNKQNATTALIRADEAMTEIGTATFRSTEQRGKRLEDTLNKLRSEIYELAQNITGTGGGELTEGVFYDELNNAIASVDVTIEDGLKLDYRLRELASSADIGVKTSEKELVMPYKYEMETPSQEVVIPEQEGVIFLDAEVTVLNQNGDPFLDQNNEIITGIINSSGKVVLTEIPLQPCRLYFPVQMKFKDIPDDFLYLFAQQMIQKNSRIMEVILTFEDDLKQVIDDVKYMKGVNWTPDISLMKNHQDIIREQITPKGLRVEVKNGIAHLMFSYNDSPELSHFVGECYDEETKSWIPYNGTDGIIPI